MHRVVGNAFVFGYEHPYAGADTTALLRPGEYVEVQLKASTIAQGREWVQLSTDDYVDLANLERIE